jgi:riboflavin kinase/FMN adenylyltransferase
MQYKSHTIRGHGRGKSLGYPTLNLELKGDIAFSLPDGIYAAWAWVQDKKYPAALYIGPVPVFDQKEKSLELYLLDEFMIYVGEGEDVAFEPVKHIRGVQNFSSPELLVLQMGRDVEAIRKVLHL